MCKHLASIALLLLALSCQSAHTGARASERVPVTIWVIGDSTAAAYEAGRKPLTGWAEVLQERFDPSRVFVQDMARSGRSAKSFWDEGAWAAFRERILPGDYVFIQFGHNDSKKEDPARYTEPETTYKAYLTQYVNDTSSRGAHAVLLTSINRNTWDDTGRFTDSMGDYPRAVRELAAKLSLPLIDVHAATKQLFESLGPEETTTLFLHLAPGESPNYPDGKSDNTHLNELGARAVSGLVADGARDAIPRLRSGLK